MQPVLDCSNVRHSEKIIVLVSERVNKNKNKRTQPKFKFELADALDVALIVKLVLVK